MLDVCSYFALNETNYRRGAWPLKDSWDGDQDKGWAPAIKSNRGSPVEIFRKGPIEKCEWCRINFCKEDMFSHRILCKDRPTPPPKPPKIRPTTQPILKIRWVRRIDFCPWEEDLVPPDKKKKPKRKWWMELITPDLLKMSRTEALMDLYQELCPKGFKAEYLEVSKKLLELMP
mgnify:CR=1 FL=1